MTPRGEGPMVPREPALPRIPTARQGRPGICCSHLGNSEEALIVVDPEPGRKGLFSFFSYVRLPLGGWRSLLLWPGVPAAAAALSTSGIKETAPAACSTLLLVNREEGEKKRKRSTSDPPHVTLGNRKACELLPGMSGMDKRVCADSFVGWLSAWR